MGSIHEKNRGQKSCDTAPLNSTTLEMDNALNSKTLERDNALYSTPLERNNALYSTPLERNNALNHCCGSGSTFKKSSWILIDRCRSGSRRLKSLENVQVHEVNTELEDQK